MRYADQANQRRNKDSKQMRDGLIDGLIATIIVFVTLAITHYL